jgi:hypothetical protein
MFEKLKKLFKRDPKEKCKVSDKMIVVLQSKGKKTWKK